MSLLIIAIGAMLVVASIRDRQGDLFALITDDFAGQDSFLLWVGVFAFIYLIGKADPTGRIAKYFGILILLVLMLTKGRGFFDQLNSQLKVITQ